MAISNAFVCVNLNKDYFPRVKVALDCLEEYNDTQLKCWLQCSGPATGPNGSKGRYVCCSWCFHADFYSVASVEKSTDDRRFSVGCVPLISHVLHRFLVTG